MLCALYKADSIGQLMNVLVGQYFRYWQAQDHY